MSRAKLFKAEGETIAAFMEEQATIKNNTLAASTAESVTISDAGLILISTDEDLWYNVSGGTAAVPTNDSTAHSFLPGGTVDHPVAVGGQHNLSILSAVVCHVVTKIFTL